MAEPIIFAHWYHLVEGLQHSPKEFYSLIKQSLQQRNLPDIKTYEVTAREGGIFSDSREYLRVIRKEHIFDICGAPFGNGFFVSWWLGELPPGCLINIPVIGWIFRRFLKPTTYYKIDTGMMFQQSVHNAVMEVLDQITKSKGLRILSETERKPILREFFGR